MADTVPPTPPPGSGSSPSSSPAPTGAPGPAGAAGASGAKPPSQAQGKGMTWLGMNFDPEQTKQLNNIMIQNIGQQIQKYNDEGVKAIKNYQKISEGEDPDI